MFNIYLRKQTWKLNVTVLRNKSVLSSYALSTSDFPPFAIVVNSFHGKGIK